MDLKLINDKGEAVSNLAASDDLFGRDFNEALIHQVVTAYQANGRKELGLKKGVARLQSQPANPGAKKGPAALVQVWRPVHCGAAAVRFSRTSPMKTSVIN